MLIKINAINKLKGTVQGAEGQEGTVQRGKVEGTVHGGSGGRSTGSGTLPSRRLSWDSLVKSMTVPANPEQLARMM